MNFPKFILASYLLNMIYRRFILNEINSKDVSSTININTILFPKYVPNTFVSQFDSIEYF